MKISGYNKTSLIDYPGRVCSLVYTQGCNFDCDFCHNRELIPFTGNSNIEFSGILAHLEKRKGLLGGVAITGGEPLAQKGLKNALNSIISLGFPVKIDTNGSFPDVLKDLFSQKLISYVAMDIKAPLELYDNYSKDPFIAEKLSKSIEIISKSGVDHEFRTTLTPLALENIEKIAELVPWNSKWYVQQFNKEESWEILTEKYPVDIPGFVVIGNKTAEYRQFM